MKYMPAALLSSVFFLLCMQTVNAREHFPAPETVSPELQKLIDAPTLSWWDEHPQNPEEWKKFVKRIADNAKASVPELRAKMNVRVVPEQLGGVNVSIITPENYQKDDNRVLLHFHGGGYVLNPGEAGTPEAIYMAGLGGMKVISVDYRMPPDFPYPAALDDAMAVYRELLKTHAPEEIGVFGTSTGGGMTLALALRARDEGLPMPGALAPGTPWTDMTKTGDSYYTNEGVDNILGGYDGWVKGAAQLYANGHDLKDPLLSPVYGDVRGLPPTLLTSGTRDLFLSNTVRMHKKLLEADVPAYLIVFEGMSHAQYYMSPDAPETRFHFTQLKKFFDDNLEKGNNKQR